MIAPWDDVVLFNTFKISSFKNGFFVSSGTGFTFYFKYNKITRYKIIGIVTNKHVVEGCDEIRIAFSLKNIKNYKNGEKYYNVTIKNARDKIVNHPDPTVDLCVILIQDIIDEIVNKKIDIYNFSFSRDSIPSQKKLEEEFFKVEDVTIVGYPDGMIDDINNLPIVRKGITATPLQFDFQDRPEFLVDASIFGGSSGSPVFILNNGAYSCPRGYIVGDTRMYLVGIIRAVGLHILDGKIVANNSKKDEIALFRTDMPNNLGVAIHARKLLDFDKIL